MTLKPTPEKPEQAL